MDFESGNNPHKRSFENSDNAGPAFKRQRGSFRGNQNYNNQGRQNFNRGGRGSFSGRQNFNRGRGNFHGGQNYNRGGGGRGGRGSFRGQRGGYYSGGRFNKRGSYPRQRGGFKNASSNKQESCNVIEMSFPNIKGSYKEILTEILNNGDMFLRPRPITSTCSIEGLQEKLSLLKEIMIDGNKLNITVSSSSIHLNRKTVQLPEKFASQVENIKTFFGAESIEPVKSFKDDRYIPMHILTFASEQAAKDASTKFMILNNYNVGLKPYYNVETLYSDVEEKTDMENFNERAKAILDKQNAAESSSGKNEEAGTKTETEPEDDKDDGEDEKDEDEEEEEKDDDDDEQEEKDDDEQEEEDDEQEEENDDDDEE